MSPRAACRLTRLGFDAYDYAAGKVDWLAAGLPTEPANHPQQRAIDAADREPPTCPPDAVVGDAALFSGSDRHGVLVVDDDRVVLGRLTTDQLEGASTRPVEEVMEPGPATVRAHEPLDPLLARMTERHVTAIVVTTPEGQLLGVVHA